MVPLKCPDHDKFLKLVPAGVSKRTGRPYDAFYVCPTTGCKNTAPAANEPSYEETQDIEQAEKDFGKKEEPVEDNGKAWREMEPKAAGDGHEPQ